MNNDGNQLHGSGTAGLTDVATLRRNAREQVEQGAITETYSADR